MVKTPADADCVSQTGAPVRSYVNRDHLQFFHFIGRVVGKVHGITTIGEVMNSLSGRYHTFFFQTQRVKKKRSKRCVACNPTFFLYWCFRCYVFCFKRCVATLSSKSSKTFSCWRQASHSPPSIDWPVRPGRWCVYSLIKWPINGKKLIQGQSSWWTLN